jgi:hypothetical protein
MMQLYLSIFSFLSLLPFSFSQNLIPNSSFEINGQLNCSSWYDACKQELTYLCDTLVAGNPCDIAFYQDTPPEGGTWSLGATGIGNGFPATASTYITGQSGTHRYLLNVWMKDDGQAFGGTHIRIHSNGQDILEKSIPTSGMGWNFYSIIDTLKLDPTDSIEITLSAFAAGPSFGDIYFDQVEFILLDSLSAVTGINSSLYHISVFPNPVNEFLTITLQDQNVEHTISIYSLTGQIFHSLITSEQSITVNMTDWKSGIYLYLIERTKGRKQIGVGKFIVDN